MPVTVGQRTFGQTVVEVARQLGLFLAQGTATAGTGTTLTDATNMRLPVANANDIVGKFLYIYAGTSAGTIREVTSYGTIGVFTWTGTATTPDTTSLWVLLDKDPTYITAAVEWAQRILGFKLAVPYDCTSLSTHNLLDWYGDFEEWESSTAPDGWSNSGAGAVASQYTTLGNAYSPAHGLSALRVVSAVAGHTLLRVVPQEYVRQMKSGSLTYRGLMAENTAGDAVARVSIDAAGASTAVTNFTGTYTGTVWEELADISSSTITIPTNMTAVTTRLLTAASVTCYYDDIKLYGPKLYAQYLPSSLVAMHPVIWMEATEDTGDYLTPLRYKEDWMLRRVSSTNPRMIQWLESPPAGRHLLIQGIKVPGVVTGTTTNLNVDANVVAAVATAHIKGATSDAEREAQQFQRQASTLRGRGPLVWIENSLATT